MHPLTTVPPKSRVTLAFHNSQRESADAARGTQLLATHPTLRPRSATDAHQLSTRPNNHAPIPHTLQITPTSYRNTSTDSSSHHTLVRRTTNDTLDASRLTCHNSTTIATTITTRPLLCNTKQEWAYNVKPGEEDDPATLTIKPEDENAKIPCDVPTVYRNYGYAALADDFDDLLPKNSIKPLGDCGPWRIYDTYHKLSYINEAFQGKLIIKTADKTIPCSLTVRKVETQPKLNDSFDRQYMDRETAHGMIFLRSDWEFMFVEAAAVRVALEKTGHLVLRCDRPSIKFEGTPLGDAGVQGVIHINPFPTPGMWHGSAVGPSGPHGSR